jgi:hypothetical protein
MKVKVKQGRRASRNDQLLTWIEQQIDPQSTVLDLGCGPKLYSTPLKQTGSTVVTVDAWDWVEPDVVADLETVPLNSISGPVDYILMIDFIEHLTRESGLRLLGECKQLVRKKIFLLTPMEPLWTDNTENVNDPRLWSYGNQWDVHRSLWRPEDFEHWTRVELSSLKDYWVGYYAA